MYAQIQSYECTYYTHLGPYSCNLRIRKYLRAGVNHKIAAQQHLRIHKNFKNTGVVDFQTCAFVNVNLHTFFSLRVS